MSEEFKRPAMLDELDKFNTAPPADSIMQSILKEEEANAQTTRQAEITDESVQTEPVKKELPSDYLPLNSSIQELNNKVDQRLNGIERTLIQRLDNLSSTVRQPQPQQQPQDPFHGYDRETPLTLEHISPLTQRTQAANDMAFRAYVRSEYTRAQLEYERFKQTHPEFDLNPQEIDHAVGQMVSNGKWSELENVNWRGHFEQLNAPKTQAKYSELEKKYEALQKEIEGLKKRPAASVPSTPVSPAVGRSPTRAIESPTSLPNDDVLQMKEFRQKGNFKGFGKRITQNLGNR